MQTAKIHRPLPPPRLRTLGRALLLATLLAGAPALAGPTLTARTEEGDAVDLRLVREALRIDIDAQYASAKLEQVWENASGARAEGSYLLHAGEGAKVHGFSYKNGEIRIVGEVFERETAQRIYEEITGLGRDPGLVEQVGEGAFSFRVFPIEPGEKKPVDVTFGRFLDRRSGKIELAVPLASASAEVAVSLSDARPLLRASSSTHALRIEAKEGGRWEIAASPKEIDPGLGPHFALAYEVESGDFEPSVVLHRDAGARGYFSATLEAPLGLARSARVAKDVTIVLDRSGSMEGEAMQNAKRAAASVARHLAPEDGLNVLLFDDKIERLFPTARPADASVKAAAERMLEGASARGGTDIALALREALAAQREDERPDVVLFLTDGQSDAKAALEAARAGFGARVFTVGIGSGVEKPLLARLAAEKRGRFTFIPDAASLERELAALYERIEEPVLVDVEVELRGEGVRASDVYPRSIPDLSAGDALRVSGRFEGSGPAELVFRGKLDGREVELGRAIVLPDATIGEQARPWVGRLWAEARVDDLFETIALEGDGEDGRVKDEAIELALAYNIATRYTSFLAIPESELTDAAADALGSARERRRRALEAHKDAASLSRTVMPPGDPVLSVSAPKDATSVVAYFPFGLVKDLRWDEATERFTTRFLVPKEVSDGSYEVPVVIVHADGSVEITRAFYVIDSAEPECRVEAAPGPSALEIVVTCPEHVRRVAAAWVSDPSRRIELEDGGDGRTFHGRLPLPAGRHEVRVVVADEARNEWDTIVSGEVLP